MDEELRRRAREPKGDLGVEASLLRSQLRTGQLSSAQVEFAAYLGHQPAEALFAPQKPPDWLRWITALRRDANARVVLGAFARAKSCWLTPLDLIELNLCLEDEDDDEGDEELVVVITRLIESEFLEPSRDGSSYRLRPVGDAWLAANLAFANEQAFMRACLVLLRLASPLWSPDESKRTERACLALEHWLLCPCAGHWADWNQLLQATHGLESSIEALLLRPGSPVWESVRAELVPWVLGERDPVRERVATVSRSCPPR